MSHSSPGGRSSTFSVPVAVAVADDGTRVGRATPRLDLPTASAPCVVRVIGGVGVGVPLGAEHLLDSLVADVAKDAA